ncbi:MAG: GTP-binding protein [Hyphomicrobiaceae bacterium]
MSIPLILLTGFLGSGKTTLLNALLRHQNFDGTAVLVNEIGTVGIDHNLVIGASDDILLLEGGCLCCQPKGSVAEGVSRLLMLEPAPKRIVIETSGAANPFPILETLSQHPQASTGFQFPLVTTVIDCVHGQATLAQHSEARFQLGAADVVILGKADLATALDKSAMTDIISKTNPAALRLDGAGDVLPDGFVEVLSRPLELSHARPVMPIASVENVHDASEFETVGLAFDGWLEAAAVQDWIDEVLNLYGGNILRIKGILNLREFERPAVLQCVRDIVHPIELLDVQAGQAIGWEAKRNNIVAIGWDMHPDLLREALTSLADQAK